VISKACLDFEFYLMNLKRNLVWLVLMGVLALQPGAAFAKDGDGKESKSGSSGESKDGDHDGGDDHDGGGDDNDNEGHNYDDDNDDHDEDSNSLSNSSGVAASGNVGNSNSTRENRAINEAKSSNAASLREVFDVVKKSYGGEIVHVSLSGSGSSLTYGIRLLDKSSNILDLQVNARSLAIAISPIP
jgi:uncharacterized membrane protein YkoI